MWELSFTGDFVVIPTDLSSDRGTCVVGCGIYLGTLNAISPASKIVRTF
ncbi:hypothetical protein LEP1GSC043_1277 [Leptospira weilii str. Ecochallenge]|uniref:Uncharacterized protein n=1 Tax=Leptospira weilii str. Ecochallenge TaxID=1049986 RepID=N1U936_9LEPT|nr:hypothetical protein LEP1GSC043_1277 [Leptospira weilii str. Ecochallenge]